jgi:beta-phosphoglucomutase-like phosphatase (HAD superfamily)
LSLPRRPRAIDFDLDGTLIDSEALVKKAHFAACASMGVAMSDAPFLSVVGMHREANDLQLKAYYGDDSPLEHSYSSSNAPHQLVASPDSSALGVRRLSVAACPSVGPLELEVAFPRHANAALCCSDS